MNRKTDGRNVVITLPCLLKGGTEIQTLNLVKALKSIGFNILVFCFFEWDQQVVDGYEREGCQVIRLNYPRKISIVFFVCKTVKLFRQYKPDIVHIQYLAPGASTVIAAWIAGIKIRFVTIHQPGTPYGKAAHCLVKLSCHLSTKFISVSQAVEKSWFGSSLVYDINNSGKKHFTIYNTIDTQRIDEILSTISPNSFKLPENHIIIGTISRLRYEKGIDLLIDAFQMIAYKRDDVTLLIVGDGEDREMLEKKAKHLGIMHKIIWEGAVSWENAILTMSSVDILVYPSRFEGFGLAVAEGMYLGKPIIAASVGGIPELITDRSTGRLVPSGDSQSIVTALLDLMSDFEIRFNLGKNAKQVIIKKFSFQQYLDSIVSLYQLSKN